jgi:hypothetical protein
MIVRAATPGDISFICGNMSEHSRRESMLARYPDFSPRDLANEILQLTPITVAQVVFLPAPEAEPAFLFACYVAGPSVWSFRTLSTDAWLSVAHQVPRWLRRRLYPLAIGNGVRMAEFNVIAEPTPNYRWFALMGARPWGNPLPRGRNGELFHAPAHRSLRQHAALRQG